jgi:hypothetical protein
MQLSIEAIIILVIAMVLLGFGIKFVTELLGKGQDKLGDAFDPLTFGCDPSANEPLTLSKSEITVSTGKTQKVNACVYASKDYKDGTVQLAIRVIGDTCFKSDGTNAGLAKPIFATAPQPVAKGSKGGFPMIITASDAAPNPVAPGIYLCTIKAVTVDASTGTERPATNNMITSKQITVMVE